MRDFIISFLVLIVVWACGSFEVVNAQPQGWPCDYGYRPGNTWFYRSTSFTNGYSETVLRDSVGADGAYWVYFRESTAPVAVGYWFRIDSNCVFQQFNNPLWKEQALHWFVGQADSGDQWVVDSISTRTPLLARVHDIYYLSVFGKRFLSKDVVYYSEGAGDGWYFSMQWAEELGIIRKR